MATTWQAIKKPTPAMLSVLPLLLLDPCRLTPLKSFPCIWIPNTCWWAAMDDDPTLHHTLSASSLVNIKRGASWHSATHNTLPHDLLREKRILGCLLELHGAVRFLTSPEVASIHGARFQMLLPQSDRTSMRISGNALPSQQPTMVLALALHATPIEVLCLQSVSSIASNCG